MSIPGSATPLLLATTAAGPAAAYQINRSLRFNRADDAHLSKTISTKYTTFTTSCWVKRASFNTWQYIWAQYDGSAYRGITFGQGNDKLSLYDGNHVYTTAVFRDPAAWYHIVLKCSSGAATLYVNNTQVSTTTNFFIGGGSFRIGDFITGSNELDGYIADFHAVLGTAHDPTDFAEYDDNNNWNPKEFSGNFGSDGFHLDFSDNSSNEALGYDQSVTAPDPNPDGGMDVVTWTGNGSTQTISGLGFQPDFVWIKARSAAYDHYLQDVVRGATKTLEANNTGTETTNADGVTEFTSDGFKLGAGTGNTAPNVTNVTYVGWAWKAGGAPTTLTAGSVDAQVSANTEYGFSVITATQPGTSNLGCTVAHGLGSAPAWYIVKDRDLGVGWGVYHSGMSNAASNALQLNSNGSVISGGYWRNEAPTSSVLSISASIVAENDDFLVYAWAEVSGFSKFGSYTGNGSSTGPTVTTGFKPRYVLIKRTDSAGNWGIYDTERGGFTDNNKTLLADTSGSESTDNNKISITSTGFSPASGFANVNANGGAYIYAAFADRPGNNFDVNNLVATAGADNDSLLDTPTNYEASSGNNGGNYCTLNPLAKGAATTLSNGNLNYVGGAANQTLGTIGMSSGKWYWEDHKISGTYGATGIALADAPLNNHPGQGNSWAYNKNGSKWHNGSSSSYGATWDSGDTIGIAFDADAGTLVFYKNGVSQGTAFTGLTNGPYFVTGADNSVTGYFNFGASGSFAYTPPTGYKSLCTQNLPDPTIADGSTAMDAKLWTGTGATRSITSYGFSPDWVWIKQRDTTRSNNTFDIVRGANKPLFTDLTLAELSDGRLTSFDSTGFTLDSDNAVNDTNGSYVGFAWDGGTSTVSNTDGSITSSVRANASAGFSIVSYTGNNGSSGTIGHGLNAAPSMFIVKNRGTTTDDWIVYHKSLGATKRIKLNSTAAADTNSSQFNDTEPTSSVFTVGSLQNINDNYNYIAYCFAPVEGYSAFGSYTGNGSSSDGTFVHLGFRPKFLLVKGNATIDWIIEDSSRDTFNQMNKRLYPNDSVAESTSTNGNMDFLSNGFKPRTAHLSLNSSGTTYYYAAFCEHPFKTARAR